MSEKDTDLYRNASWLARTVEVRRNDPVFRKVTSSIDIDSIFFVKLREYYTPVLSHKSVILFRDQSEPRRVTR